MRFFSCNVAALSVFLFMSEVHGLRLSKRDSHSRLLESSETDSSDRTYTIEEALRPGFPATVTYTYFGTGPGTGHVQKTRELIIRLECFDREKGELSRFSFDCEEPVFTFVKERHRNLLKGKKSQRLIDRLANKSKMVLLRDVKSVAIEHKRNFPSQDKYEITVSTDYAPNGFKVSMSNPYIAVDFCRYVLDIAHAYSENMIHRSDYVEKFLQSLNEKTVFAQDPNFKEYLENPVYNSMSKINYRAASQSLTAFTLRQRSGFYDDADSFLAFLENKTGFQVLPYQKAETQAETLLLGDGVITLL